MISPTTLQDAIVDKLRAIPELVAFIGDVADIQAYDDESMTDGDPDSTEFTMMGRAVMVFWTGASTRRAGETQGWTHTFKIGLKAESIVAYFQLAQLIIDGKPTDDWTNFLASTISDLTTGLQDVTVEPARSDDGVGRLSITFSITEL